MPLCGAASWQVVDKHTFGRQAGSSRHRVFGEPTVVVEVEHRNAAGERGEVCDQAAMAAPPLALAAHHGGRGCLQFSEQAADCLEELGAAHVVGVRAKGVYPPPLVWGFGR